MNHEQADSELQRMAGGRIPGAPGIPAFHLHAPEPSPVPVLIAVPHAGRAYPRALLGEMRHAESAALRLEDRYVDLLGKAVARATGASLLVAEAPRAMIDLNRAPDDVDWDMFARAGRPQLSSAALPSARARSGLGLIPRRLPGLGEIWRRRHEEADLSARITGIHTPYHEALSRRLGTLRERWGAALLLDLHSMPPLTPRTGHAPVEFVIGDRFGVSCHGSVIGAAFAHFSQIRREAAHNRPYAGGYVLERHAQPRAGIHAFQLEIDRSRYLDSRLAEPGPGIASMTEDLVALVRRLAGVMAELGQDGMAQDWPMAAE